MDLVKQEDTHWIDTLDSLDEFTSISRSRSKRSDPFTIDDAFGWPLLAVGLATLFIVMIVLVVCMCRRSSARKRSPDGKEWVEDNTPIVFNVNPGYDNLAFSSVKDNSQGSEVGVTYKRDQEDV